MEPLARGTRSLAWAMSSVNSIERALGARPSEPQAYFGLAVADLKVGF